MAEVKQVLIVEDTEENVVFLSQILEDNGYGYRVTRNGKEAMAAMRESLPDAVLLDLMMPRKTGISVYREMKEDPALVDVPIIVVTGASETTGVDLITGEVKPNVEPGDEVARDFGKLYHEMFKDLAPDGFVEKPIDPPVLVKTLAEVLG